MKRLHCVLGIAMAALLSACGSLQSIPAAKVPAAVAANGVALSQARPTKDEVDSRSYEIPEHSAFVRQTSGGSVAVGVLLGPLGVLANSMNIDRLTQDMGESGKSSALYQLDARAEAIAAIGDELGKLNAGSIRDKAALKPYLMYFVADEKVGIQVQLHLRAESTVEEDGKSKPWVGEYVVLLRDALPFSALTSQDPAALQALRGDIKAGYRELLDEMAKDFSAGALPRRDIAWVIAPVLGLGMPGDIEYNAQGHMVLRSQWGKYNLVIFQDKKSYAFSNGPVPREQG
ncbi:hypothetical protein [Chromobacterium subtsugae]|uniref:hypothetical protein n=1 Tax=Chromobacterium subtsugae TaxID=251747 RepID=UPI000A84FE66|nr:hypothetical protein [Chromobacterium subtsugae]